MTQTRILPTQCGADLDSTATYVRLNFADGENVVLVALDREDAKTVIALLTNCLPLMTGINQAKQ